MGSLLPHVSSNCSGLGGVTMPSVGELTTASIMLPAGRNVRFVFWPEAGHSAMP